MKFEGVFPKAMGGQLFQVFGDIDDANGIEGTFLDADAAADAKYLRNIADFRLRGDLNTDLLGLIDGTILFALLLAPLRLALLGVDDGNSVLILHSMGCC